MNTAQGSGSISIPPGAGTCLHLLEHTRDKQPFPPHTPRRQKQETACLDIRFLTAFKQIDMNRKPLISNPSPSNHLHSIILAQVSFRLIGLFQRPNTTYEPSLKTTRSQWHLQCEVFGFKTSNEVDDNISTTSAPLQEPSTYTTTLFFQFS